MRNCWYWILRLLVGFLLLDVEVLLQCHPAITSYQMTEYFTAIFWRPWLILCKAERWPHPHYLTVRSLRMLSSNFLISRVSTATRVKLAVCVRDQSTSKEDTGCCREFHHGALLFRFRFCFICFLFCETIIRVGAVGKKISAERRNQLRVKYSMRHAQKGNNPDVFSLVLLCYATSQRSSRIFKSRSRWNRRTPRLRCLRITMIRSIANIIIL